MTRIKLRTLTITILFGFSFSIGESQNLTQAEQKNLEMNSPDMQRYINGRSADWMKTRNCLSCHTTISFAFGADRSTNTADNFEKIVKYIAPRVANGGPTQLWYSSDRAGISSLPTESVIYANLAVFNDIKIRNGQVSNFTLDALKLMFSTQRKTGGWHWLDFNLQPFESLQGEVWGNALALLTIGLAQNVLKIDLDKDYVRDIKLLRDFLATRVPGANLQGQAMALYASTYNTGFLSHENKTLISQAIARAQGKDGSFSAIKMLGFGDDSGNAYATSIAIIGLTQVSGFQPEVSKASRWLISTIRVSNGQGIFWQTPSVNKPGKQPNDTWATDAATGYAAHALRLAQKYLK